MLLSSLSFAYECRRTVAVTMLHTARRRKLSVHVRKCVTGWVVGGRYGAWVDYICMYIYIYIPRWCARPRCCFSTMWWVGGLVGKGILGGGAGQGTRSADGACARCSSRLITARCVFVARRRVRATAVCRRAPPNAYATLPLATDRAGAARRNNLRARDTTRTSREHVAPWCRPRVVFDPLR